MSISESRGRERSWSKSNQPIQRPLFEAAEISRIKPDEALIHIRGYNIFKNKKYPLEKHPNITLTTDCSDKNVAKSNEYTESKLHELLQGSVELESKKNDGIIRYDDVNLETISNENVIYFKHEI